MGGNEPWQIVQGDCLEVLRHMPDQCIDGIVTDPPYGLGTPPDALAMLQDWIATGQHEVRGKGGFMGKTWDAFVPQPLLWRECLRVIKPGGHLVAFAGTRTQDLMGLALRLAGWDLRDCLMWIFGTGFPKSANVAKEIAKQDDQAAVAWQGWGTALKPGYEPILLCRKPLDGTVAQTVLKWGTGALNVGGCRVGTFNDGAARSNSPNAGHFKSVKTPIGTFERCNPSAPLDENQGRWPANVVIDDSEVVSDGFPITKSGRMVAGTRRRKSQGKGGYHGGFPDETTPVDTYGDSGSAARFFYCAKATRRDREDGLTVKVDERINNHPTVKPTMLMEWLCRLIVPPGGMILDPFMGSGSTGKACMYTGHRFLGIEQDAEYCEIARSRIAWAANQMKDKGDLENQLELFDAP